MDEDLKSDEDNKSEKQPDNRDQIIFDLRFKLEIEKYKNKIYESILKKVELSPLEFLPDDTGLKINWKGGSIPVTVLTDHVEKHPYIKTQVKVKEKTKEKPEKRKRGRSSERGEQEKVVFRSAKASLLVQIPPQQEEEMINKAKLTLEQIGEQYGFNISLLQVRNTIKSAFLGIDSPRVAQKKIMESMLQIRANQPKLLGKLKLEEYIFELKANVETIKTTLKRKDLGFIQSSISTALSPLDQRFLYFGKYYDTEIAPEDFERFQQALFYTASHPTRYIKYSSVNFFSQFENYGSVIFELRTVLRRILTNVNGFNSLVYVHQGKSTVEDPFTFYRLDEIGEKGERKWKIENRLYEFCMELQPQLTRFFIDIFRRIYLDVFKDNNYRPDYRSKAYIFQVDCDQLIINLFCIGNIIKFSSLIRYIVKKHCTIEPTTLDKFDYSMDETEIRHKCARSSDNSLYIPILRRLFDTITQEECTEFLESRNLIDKFIEV